jgi:hypothetical protein
MNRRIPNGTYGGVRGRGLVIPSYSITQNQIFIYHNSASRTKNLLTPLWVFVVNICKQNMSVDYPKLDSRIPCDLLCFSKITVISERQSIGKLPFSSCL